MGTLYITEYSNVATLPNATGQVPQEPALARQTVSIGASSTPSANFQTGTRLIRVHADSICQILINVTPNISTTGDRMVAGQTEFHGVPEGGKYAIAVIQGA